mgnify:CR=1 FL=1
MKKKCFKCFVLLLLIYKVFSLVHTPQKIISNNNQKDMQIVHSYMVYQEHSVQKYPHTNNGGGKVCDLAFFLCKSIIFFEIVKFAYEITKVHVYIWQLPRVGIGGIIAKRTNVRFYFPRPDIYCSIGGSYDREGCLWIIRKRLLN